MKSRTFILSTPKIDLTGRRFGKWLVLRYLGREQNRWGSFYQCLCDCGFECAVAAHPLLSGNSEKCKNCRGISHGDAKKSGHGRLYRIWSHMLSRCNNKTNDYYHIYGGKGVKVCQEWTAYESFKAWAIANGYADNLSIDRINGNGNYEPNNCRWATSQQQAANKLKQAGTSKYKGVSFCKRTKKWEVAIKVAGQKHFLGRFASEIDAAKAYDEKATELCGCYASLNFPKEKPNA